MIRDYRLLVRVGEGNQLSFETASQWVAIDSLIRRRLGGSVREIEARPPNAIWHFDTYLGFEPVRAALTKLLPAEQPWVLGGRNRFAWSPMTPAENATLVEAFRRNA